MTIFAVHLVVGFDMQQLWTPGEDYLLLKLIALLGPRWTRIQKAFPDRTIPSVRNRWLRIEKAYSPQELRLVNEHTRSFA